MLLTLPGWLQGLQKLSLCGCNSLDFGALATFLNISSVTELDLSSCYTLMRSPFILSSFLKVVRKLKKLRSERKKRIAELKRITKITVSFSIRFYGQPAKVDKPALFEAQSRHNSQFAFAIIQSLLANGAAAFEAIE